MSIKVNLWEQTQSEEGCDRISADVLSFICNVVFCSHNYLIFLVCVFVLQVKLFSFQLSQPLPQFIRRLSVLNTHTHSCYSYSVDVSLYIMLTGLSCMLCFHLSLSSLRFLTFSSFRRSLRIVRFFSLSVGFFGPPFFSV